MDEDILAILISGIILFIPVAGLTIRFALKPVVESIARLMEARAGSAANDILERRVALLEQELNVTRDELRSLSAKHDFDRRLSARRDEDV